MDREFHFGNGAVSDTPGKHTKSAEVIETQGDALRCWAKE